MTDLSVVIPAHNESENLKILLPKLKNALSGLNCELVIVDNASTDNSREVLAEFQKTIPNLVLISEPKLGYGHAVLAGLAAARGDFLGIIRSDNQEDPQDLLKMYQVCRKESLHFYKAIRKSRINDGLKRIVISRIFNFLFRILFGFKAVDINAAPKIFSREFYKRARLESTDWFIDAELVIKAAKLGYTIGEMPIEYLPRLKGKSTVRLVHIWQFLKNMIIWYGRIQTWHE